jgi:mitochondrial FAD-linked sulfhydryl oxidase
MSSAWERLKEKFQSQDQCAEPSCAERTRSVANKSIVYPPDRSEIGRATWMYLHARAEVYDPSKIQQEMKWLESFVALYPCKLCARDFASICFKMPPNLESKEKYVNWWIDAHNEVNKDLGKPIFSKKT